MRVLVVARSVPPHEQSGGMEKITWQIATGLRRAGCDVTVLTTRVPGRSSSFELDGIAVRTVALTRPGRYSLPWWFATATFPTSKFTAVLSVSVGGASMILLRRGSTAYVMHVHGTARREFVGVVRERGKMWPLKALRLAYWIIVDMVLYARSDAVLAASEHVRSGLKEWPYHASWRAKEPETVVNGVDVKSFQSAWAARATRRREWSATDDETVVLSIGRLTRQKGVDRLVSAIEPSPDSTKFIIVGAGPEYERLLLLTGQAGDEGKARIVGPVSADQVPAVMSAADVLVFAARHAEREGLPLVVIEALASGLQVVVPHGSRWPANLMRFLIFVDVEDPIAIAEAVTQIRPVNAVERPARLPVGYDICDVCRRVLDILEREARGEAQLTRSRTNGRG